MVKEPGEGSRAIVSFGKVGLARPEERCWENISASGKVGGLFRLAPEIYPGRMVRRLHNWTYSDITNFLRENGFNFFKELPGSHEAWIKLGDDGEPDRIVEVNFTHRSYPVRTLKMMIRQSGIHQNEWIEWGQS